MLPHEDLELEIDPEPALEREAEETAQQVMEGEKLGIQRLADAEVHIQRAGLGNLSSNSTWNLGDSAGKATSSTNEKVNLVADEVTADPEALAEEVKQIKANQAKLFAEMAKGIAGDVTKMLTGSAYEKGSEVVSGKASDAKEYVDRLIEKKLEKYLDRSDTVSGDRPESVPNLEGV
ncbi:hypothetical protein halTADL_0525 [Halohasta litchfieldiae]|jgi:hypothetical protein|uniref:Uncharacterized protein n=1 Tax=Halohasta litchfieldiae TaxID=1073996 RepID=A0A1H6WIN1_9EURY|nr:hypothetical protein [Halohasta litchfieldiae]ATW87332.1 hypothetical protein halTADL_0525 [Halohasta litchfieldiae]SEJ16788.1 hypothetical protein SAMN05444271_12716 [Halohasta litchfieldiae]